MGDGESAGQTPRGEYSVAEVEPRGLRESAVGSELEAVDKPKVGTVLGGEGHATKPPLVPATHDAFHPLNGQWTVEKPLVAPLSIGERVHHTDTAQNPTCIQILGPQFRAASALDADDNQRVPE